MRRLWIAGLVAAIQVCGPTVTVDRIPSVEFGGRTYDLGGATHLDVQATDLTAIGELPQAFPLAADRGVLSLSGLDDADAIFMRAVPGETTEYLIGFARGAMPDSLAGESDEDAARRLLVALPGLCRYHTDPPASSCD